ncbi:unnamed protein product, partial [marine sediment metagenome]
SALMLQDVGISRQVKENISRFTILRGTRSPAQRNLKMGIAAELLVAKGAYVNVEDGKGRSHLQLPKEKGHKEVVELLRKHGAKE